MILPIICIIYNNTNHYELDDITNLLMYYIASQNLIMHVIFYDLKLWSILQEGPFMIRYKKTIILSFVVGWDDYGIVHVT